ncbi:MAG: hypothetical protein LV480_12595 [Methylacidiphilales bacterium]|nr:hypothetical protein [Candidatus Methylacidiphilales bacterium]
MTPTAQPSPPAAGFLWLAGAALFAGYLALGWVGSNAGISALDANGIIHLVNEQLQTGVVEISRPPGHPMNEFWALPSLMRVMQLAGAAKVLSPLGYGLYQLAGGVFCLVTFWFLLGEFSLSLTRRLLATACLAFAPEFLITSSDSEEFLWGMACVLAVVLIISRISSGAIRQPLAGWCLAVALAAAASGYRIEYGAVALLVVFATLFVSDQSWARKFGLAGLALLLLLIVWSPVLIHQGMVPPDPNPLNLKTRVEIGVYKIAFHALGIVPLMIATVFLFQSRKSLQLLPTFPKNILNYWSFWLMLIFFAIYFVYPTKIEIVQPAVAFLILLGAVHAGRWTWTCFVLACASLQLVHLDCFSNRSWTGLNVQPSLWTQNLSLKPSFIRPEADAAARVASEGRHVFISKIRTWELAWQRAHTGWPGVPDPENKNPDFIETYDVGPGIVATPSLLDNKPQLAQYIHEGYDIWIDKRLYREMFMRYDLSTLTPATAVIEGFPCRIVDAK